MRIAAILLLATTTATAGTSAKIPGTALTIASTGSGVEVQDGKTAARLPLVLPYPDRVMDVDVKATGTAVTILASTNCQGDATLRTSVAALEARLRNVAGMQLLGAKKYDDAADAFAQALARDPDLDIAALNLASARARAGKRDAAIAALVGLAAKNPALVVWRANVDPDLAALAEARELARFRAAKPGDITGLKTVAYAPEKGLWAFRRELSNSMSGESSTSIEIRDAADKLLVSEAWTGSASQLAGLRALGFTADVEVVEPEPTDAGDKSKGYFARSKIGVVVSSTAVRFLRGNTVLGEKSWSAQHTPWVAVLPKLGAIASERVSIGDGCGGWNYTTATFIKLSPVP